MEYTVDNILLGAWLQGIHLEDLHKVDIRNFSAPKLLKLLRDGKTMLEICQETKRWTELAELTGMYTETLYKNALASVMKQDLKVEIQKCVSIDRVAEKIEAYKNESAETIEPLKDMLMTFTREMSERLTSKAIRYERMQTLQTATGGIKRKELTAIAGRPGTGKSAFAIQIAVSAWEQGAKVIFFPLEMSAASILNRILQHKLIAPAKDIKSGDVKGDQMEKALEYLQELQESERFLIYEGESSIERIEQIILKEQPYLVIIDQLTQLKSTSRNFRDIRERFSYMTSTLKAFTLKYKVAIMLLCQLNRNSDSELPRLDHLKESGSIEEDSDNVILLHALTEKQVRDPARWMEEASGRPLWVKLAKQRDGEVGTMSVIFYPQTFGFYDANERIYN